MKRTLSIAAVGVLTLVAATSLAQHSPYRGMETREIKALSPETVTGYLEGRGMGFAMAAELNSYPGPKHVLELAEALELDAAQTRKTQEAFDRMHARAVKLGAELVDRERELDLLFAEGRAKKKAVRSLIAELGRIRSELRFAHVEAHLEMREVLTEAQIATYDKLRGYGGQHGHHHGHHPD